jgi:hypothetical protein
MPTSPRPRRSRSAATPAPAPLDDEATTDLVDGEPPDAPAIWAQTVRAPVVKGDYEDAVDVALIVTPGWQRDLSAPWVRKAGPWNPALGWGIVLRVVDFPRSKAGFEALLLAYPEDQRDLLRTIKAEYAYFYEVLIGQHRTDIARTSGEAYVPALVLAGIDDDTAAALFVEDARSARPLRGIDVHRAELIRKQPRALAIQAELDAAGLTLVPRKAGVDQVGCIRALEKVAGEPFAPDVAKLGMAFAVLRSAFPAGGWGDAMVKGLGIAFNRLTRDPSATPPGIGWSPPQAWKALDTAALSIRRRYGTVQAFASAVTSMRNVLSEPAPTAAADLWVRAATGSGTLP